MKNCILFLPVFLCHCLACAQGTAFIYQGRLTANGAPASGTYDFRFRLAADPLANTYVGPNVLTNGVAVNGGLFAVPVDFGSGLFTGNNYWLEVDVRTNGGSSYTALSPLQPLSPTPYAMMAGSASNLLGTLPVGQLNGTVPLGQLPAAVVTNNSAVPVALNGTFSGNGTGLTNLNATTLGGQALSNLWQLGGNNVAPGQFLGSTNSQMVEFRVGNLRAMALQFDGQGVGAPNVIGGSHLNYVSPAALGATIGGGGGCDFWHSEATNVVSGDWGTVGGGLGNTSSGPSAFIGGGGFDGYTYGPNVAAGAASVVTGGYANQTTGDYAVVGGGMFNRATGAGATIGGGGEDGGFNYSSGNTASGPASTISGGWGNTNSGWYASIPGGKLNLATATYSLAAGQQAQALHQGAFVWADSQNARFASTTNDEFNIRAQNGVRITATKGIHLGAANNPIIVRDFDPFATNAPASKAGIGRWGLFNEPGYLALGIPSNDVAPRYFEVVKYSTNGTPTMLMQVDQNGQVSSSGGFRLNDKPLYLRAGGDANHGLCYNGYVGGVTNFGTGNVQVDGPVLFGFTGGALAVLNGGAHAVLTWTNGGAQVNGGFSFSSDRTLKTGFAELSAETVLERVSALPISSWAYKTDTAARHVGPMAQDFHEAFQLGGKDDTHINVGDETGVALAAIQGLDRKLETQLRERDATIRDLQARVRQVDALEARLRALEQRLAAASQN